MNSNFFIKIGEQRGRLVSMLDSNDEGMKILGAHTTTKINAKRSRTILTTFFLIMYVFLLVIPYVTIIYAHKLVKSIFKKQFKNNFSKYFMNSTMFHEVIVPVDNDEYEVVVMGVFIGKKIVIGLTTYKKKK